MKTNNIKTLAFGLALTCAIPAMAQNTTTIKGTVVDENGDPVIGATIHVPGTRQATVTDLDGNYSISAPKGTTLTVTYVGYKQISTKGGRIMLKEGDTDLDEVVVVGYGTQKRAHLTGSVESIPVDEIQDISSGNLASTLSGLVNGLSVSGGESQPGEAARITIRTANTLGDIGSTVQQPLFVIDGYIYPNDVKVGNVQQNLGAEAFNNLDPAEIESISVLKDASAAVYGARAANGVILVTTKKGKMGKPVISYSGQYGWTDAVATPKMLSAYNYGRLYNEIAARDPLNTTLDHTTGLFQADELEAMKGMNNDLLDKYWKTGFTQKHSVNISGASDRVNYFAGIGYFDQDGNLGRLDYNRWNYRAGVDVKISKWLGAGVTISGDYGKRNTGNVKVGGSSDQKQYNLLLMRPYYLPEYIGENDEYPILNYGPTNSEANQNQRYNYDLLINDGDYSKSMTSNLNIGANINYDFGWSKALKGLKVSFQYSKSINTNKGNEYGSNFTIYNMQKRYGSGSHLYSPLDGSDDYSLWDLTNLVAHKYDNGNYLARTDVRTDNYQMNFTVNYARDFGLHNVQALFSIEKSEAESEYQRSSVTNPYEFTTGQSNSADGTQTGVFTRSESGSLSYIGRVNYSYAGRYLFEFLMRADASQKFSPENRWGYFPATSIGWIASEEKWFKKAMPWWNFLKFRASFGLTGRDNTTAWQWMQVYAQDKNRGVLFGDYTKDTGNRITINKNNSAVNRDITWDKSYKFNFGIDNRFLNNRLSVGLDFYREWNRDMLINILQAVPSTVGTQSAASNNGEIDNWGWELSLGWRDKIGKDFKYNIGINTGYSDNKVLRMDFDQNFYYRQIQRNGRTDIGTWGMQCIGMFRSFQDIDEYFTKYHITSYMGMSKDQVRPGMLIYKDVRGSQHTDANGNIYYDGPDGIVDRDNDQVQLGHRGNIYGFTLNAGGSWKGLSFQLQFGAHWGGYTTVPAQALTASAIEYTNMPSFWNPDNVFVYQNVYDGQGNLIQAANRNACLPNPGYSINTVASSFWRISAAQVTLNRLTLAYSLPKAWLKALGIGIQNVRLNLTGQNLINFYNPYPDNFYSPYAGTYGNYPNLRKWTLGVNVSF
ncbi:SusC/RagA family TonB-linked outer membrane protein [Prevotella lacticifex]|uniref:SusC/RagA family TonB-linked outer membrane protein n=1 Tax=Prevotella lacticifex TaxID=2854755 RepID=A0A9R1CBZ8_9BACT|nr:TonB-dependent receptor [Prevotella lacticifex]GJG36600.1 SusC/RagA family TonB-linked outer membrane protein [Prevotella lacticifex]GJG38459.1 SusC/RagA family TonB-linked outer membrane protein [Prevotella lacticifex]GJG42858.1 SusC/RagA family TonB-linked outer membrane protein [Prevotella lacticifex]GJG44816.1 SusC/RagA family TonB-linked outer membrane protein [Prevotella lacticifex]GJG49209.1 SusC/RagA family TonB-linked outer membrane protein [Prevotella lacticifex]